MLASQLMDPEPVGVKETDVVSINVSGNRENVEALVDATVLSITIERRILESSRVLKMSL